ncbi:MAG: hypothetical protein EBW68_11455, partial [Actinobacteria bacterium]|nr:hypothetical protein [Actinomycetota bacterium]
PTAISPFPGASTGAGGEIRDEGATGRGSKPKAGLTGFTVSTLRWDGQGSYGKPAHIASPLQIMIEGLALAAFGYMHELTGEPLLKKLLRYVMSDEARHVAFGVLSLKEVYDGMSDAEIKDRQEFAFEASIRMRDRFLQQEVWERMGVNPRDVVPLVLQDPTRAFFQQLLFAKIVPNCKKLGLLDRNNKWLRHRFEEMGVIQFEDMENTGEEYLQFELGKV